MFNHVTYIETNQLYLGSSKAVLEGSPSNKHTPSGTGRRKERQVVLGDWTQALISIVCSPALWVISQAMKINFNRSKFLRDTALDFHKIV